MYTGPFVVVERCGAVNYVIRKTANSRPFAVHVDKLELCFSEKTQGDNGERLITLLEAMGTAAVPRE